MIERWSESLQTKKAKRDPYRRKGIITPHTAISCRKDGIGKTMSR